jgi:hypothetical protein
MKSATTSVESATTTPASVELSAAETPASAEASYAGTTNVVGVSNGPGGATTGGVGWTVTRPEVSRSADPTVSVSAIAVPTVSVSKVRSSKREPRGVKAPTEGVEENTIVRDERISVKLRVPIPSITGPEARRISGASRVRAGRINVSLRQIRCPQACPPVEIVHVRFLVEFPLFQLPGGAESYLLSALQVNMLTGYLDFGFSVKHSD